MARAWHLMNRPTGIPTNDDAVLKDVALAPLDNGMVHVRNRWLSVDPYMRSRMNDVKSYVPSFQIGEPMTGGAVGEVVESRDPSLQPGDMVLHMAGWRDEVVEPAGHFNKLPPIPGVEPQAFLANLGLTGGTAYFGLLDLAAAKAGDIVFVSAAGGAGRLCRRPDRQGQGHDRHRLSRRSRQMRIRPFARRRRSHRL